MKLIYAVTGVTELRQTTRYFYATDGETACEMHREQFPDEAIMSVETRPEMTR